MFCWQVAAVLALCLLFNVKVQCGFLKRTESRTHMKHVWLAAIPPELLLHVCLVQQRPRGVRQHRHSKVNSATNMHAAAACVPVANYTRL